jgi:hypothetical protein
MYENAYPNGMQPVSESLACPAPSAITLYNSRAVTVATFFGTPAAGSLLMALNYKRMGRKGPAAITLIIGFAVTAAAVGLGFIAPQAFTYSLGLALLYATRVVAEKLQGPMVANHVSQGGKLGSRWTALGIGVAFFVVIFLSVLVPVYAQDAKPKVKIGENDEVFYTGTATKADALALGTELKTDGYFKDRGTSVFLDKGKDGTTLSMVVKDGVWEKPEILQEEEEVAREVASVVGGFPIHVKVMDKEQQVKKQGIVGRVSGNGKDEVFYFSDATQAEAAALDKALQHEEYFSGHEASVMYAKDAGVKSISFVVSDGFWEDAGHVTSFEALVKAVAPATGGLPVTLKLVNTTLDEKKVVVVQ